MENNKLQATTSTEVATFNFFDPVQFETMQRVCKLFASSELVPDMYRESEKNPLNKAMANCMIAIEMSQRIGASALMIMQNMVIIYGRPSWSSKFLIATVNTCGRFNPLQYKFTNLGRCGKVPYTDYVWNGQKKQAVTKEFDGTQIDNIQCIAYTTAKGSTEVLESSPIDIRMAIQEGWYTKAGSKWQTMTRQMLIYRTASFWTSAYAPELSMGMKTDDEIRDIVDIDYEDVSDKVDREKSEKANKEVIYMEVGTEEVKPEPVKQPEPANKQEPATQAKEPLPKMEPSKELFDNNGTAPAKPGF